MPDIAADAIIDHGGLDPEVNRASLKVLDLGCGDGLTGKAMHRRGFQNLTGVDFSETMLEKADLTRLYRETKQVDLLEDLPYPSDEFDILVSTGVTTYLRKSVLHILILIYEYNE